MKFAPTTFISGIILSVFMFSACGPGQGDNANTTSQNKSANSNPNNNANIANDNLDELELTINLPFHPEEAVWREDDLKIQVGENSAVPADGKKLTAVLKFSTEQANKIVEQAAKHGSAEPFEMEPETWFPPELIAKSQQSGNITIKGKSYPANDFFKEPFTKGKITRIEETDFFVLELYSK